MRDNIYLYQVNSNSLYTIYFGKNPLVLDDIVACSIECS